MANLNQNRSYTVNPPASYLRNPELVEGNPKSKFSCSELGSYSIDSHGNFYNNSQRELRRLIQDYESMVDRDLTEDFDPSIGINASKLARPLNTLLRWIVLNKEKILGSSGGIGQAQKRLDAEFVFPLGTIKKLLATVFDTGYYKQAWKMYATKYNGTIYMSHMEENKESSAGPPREPLLGCRNQGDELKKIIYMGEKLEELIFVPCEANSKPADLRVDGRKGFYSVRTGKFAGRHLVLTRAQIDFIEDGQYVECKLCLEYTGEEEWKFPLYKLRNWWYHMYAGDMKQVLYGIRRGPRLKRLSWVMQSEIPSKVKNSAKSCKNPAIKKTLKRWNPRASIGFVDTFLQWLKEVVVEDSYGMDGDRAVQYALEWKKGSSSIAFSREEAHASNFVLLPDWYIEEMSRFFA